MLFFMRQSQQSRYSSAKIISLKRAYLYLLRYVVKNFRCTMNKIIKSRFATLASVTIISLIIFGSPSQDAIAQNPSPIRIGIIGLDTSHVIRFTELLNDPTRPDHVPGARVVAAYKGGSPDIEASATRIEKFTAEIKSRWGVELVGSIEELSSRVDAVMLMSVDGRVHLKQVRPVFAAKKRVFIDKPFASSTQEAREIIRLAREAGVPFFSSSALRFYPGIQELKKRTDFGNITGAFTYGPAPIEPHHPDLYWYGIHSVEVLYTLMGPGCEEVTRVHTNGADVVTGRWKDGRLGIVRGIRDGRQEHGYVVFGSKAIISSPSPQESAGADKQKSLNQSRKSDYYGIVSAIVKFFQTGIPPVNPEETLEIMAFMEAADISKKRNTSVALKEVMPDGAGKPPTGK